MVALIWLACFFCGAQLTLAAQLRAEVAAILPAVFQEPHYELTSTEGVVYGQGLTCSLGEVRYDGCKPMDLSMDVYEPVDTEVGWRRAPRPAILLVHDGGFMQDAGRREFTHKAKFFASRGFIAFNLKYRLMSDNGMYPCADGYCANQSYPCAKFGHWDYRMCDMYPAVRDFKAAVRFVKANAAKYNIDNHRIAAMGASAGASSVLAAAVSTEGSYKYELMDKDPTLQTTNLKEYSNVDAIFLQSASAAGIALMEHLHPGSTLIDQSSPPALAFHGTRDGLCSIDHMKDMQRRFAKQHKEFTLKVLDNCGHMPFCAALDDGSKCPNADSDGCECQQMTLCLTQEQYALPFLMSNLNLGTPRLGASPLNGTITQLSEIALKPDWA